MLDLKTLVADPCLKKAPMGKANEECTTFLCPSTTKEAHLETFLFLRSFLSKLGHDRERTLHCLLYLPSYD
jgi:hypothetical protein